MAHTGYKNELDAVMRKYDRESNTRLWTGTAALAVEVTLALLALFLLYGTLFATWLDEVRLTSFLGCVIAAGYLVFPARKGVQRENVLPWYDVLLLLLGSASFFYFCFRAEAIILRLPAIRSYEVVIGLCGLISLAELCRRSVGLPILCVAGFFVVYAFWYYGVKKGLGGGALRTLVSALFYKKTGVLSTPVDVCSKYIAVFIIFGAFLERTGIADLFIKLANIVAGASAGGPAKVAVISSALCGMVSGSSVGNTVTTGSVTIPMMKKTGYRPEFAAAVEAAASTGGQIMPPIMGAAAFLMVDYLDMPYSGIILRAILPACLYFTGIFLCVHLEAKKQGLRGLSRDELPRLAPLLKKLYLLLPMVLLVTLVAGNRRSMAFSAALAILASVLVSVFDAENRMTPRRLLAALAAGGQGCITVAAACGIAGVVAGCLTMTGLASQIISAIVRLSGAARLPALLLTMLCCIVLGMGVPTTANYCIMASTCAPILVKMGVEPVAAHFFVFYFGIVADITPPVALAAYAGAAIAGAKPLKTALNATKLAIAAFLIPFVLVYEPAMVLVDTTVFGALAISATALAGMFGVAAALEGWCRGPLSPACRLAAALGGLALVIPGLWSDLAGLLLLAAAFWHKKRAVI